MKHPPITPEQSRHIVDLREDCGWSVQRIANKLGLNLGAVSWHLLKLGIEKKRQSGFQLYSENC